MIDWIDILEFNKDCNELEALLKSYCHTEEEMKVISDCFTRITEQKKDLISGNNTSNLLPICPQCNDTNNLTVSDFIKLSNPPQQTITCNECNISWDQSCWFDKIN